MLPTCTFINFTHSNVVTKCLEFSVSEFLGQKNFSSSCGWIFTEHVQNNQ